MQQIRDTSKNWASSGGTYRFLRNVVMHEHGHGLGFQHTCPANGTKLMEPFIDTSPEHVSVYKRA